MATDFLIEELLCAAAFPHAVERLELMETHISWVILTGKYAYKIKKPVQFDFVDYSTLERRKNFCQQELQLNRRFAPDLYLDVVPISRAGPQLTIGDESQPLAWAVKMREFPQDAILAQRLDHDELSPESVQRFGEELARVHAGLATATPAARPCLTELIDRQSEENCEFLREVFAGDRRLDLVRRLHHWSRWEYRYCQTFFEERLAAGKVRKCHGDMHLKNVLQLDGQVMAFDGIEFNDELQWIDVMSELAFPVMDFVARGRPDLGWRLLNAYCESSGDYDGVRVLRYYLVYRALVRAKVTWLNPQHHPVAGYSPADDPAGPWDRYLKAAASFAFGMPSGLAITHGFSGSGKSTRALAFIQANGGIRIRSDVERTGMMEQSGNDPVEKYATETSDRVYQRLLELATMIIEAGFPVAVDATFLKIGRRQPFMQLAQQRQVPFQILDCDAPPEELRRRIKARYGDASEATIEVLKQQMASHDPLTTTELEYLSP